MTQPDRMANVLIHTQPIWSSGQKIRPYLTLTKKIIDPNPTQIGLG